MSAAKIAISLDPKALSQIDRLVKQGAFPSRSRLIQEALDEKLLRVEKRRLARECAKLDPQFEQALAEEAMPHDAPWPEY